MQITQAQIDALTAEDTDLAASVSNAVVRSQSIQAEVSTQETQITALQQQIAGYGAPVDLSGILTTLANIKAQANGIAAPGVVAPVLPTTPPADTTPPAAVPADSTADTPASSGVAPAKSAKGASA